MRVVALLSWYDESPTWLSAAVASAARIANHVVAVDGAYRLLPGGRGSSGVEQSDAVRLACEAAGVGCTLHVPSASWVGNEVGKRDFLFALGQTVVETPGEDWFMVIDADELVADCDRVGVLAGLAEFTGHVAEVEYELFDDLTRHDDRNVTRPHRTSMWARRLFRSSAQPIRVVGQHWNYVRVDDGEPVVLWGRDETGDVLPVDMRMVHRTLQRWPERREQQQQYYRIRNSMSIEAAPLAYETVVA